jgi:hypothetical protein
MCHLFATPRFDRSTVRFGSSVAVALWVVTSAFAQQDPDAQPNPAPTDAQALEAVVIEVQGDVKKAAGGVDPKQPDGWSAIAMDDRLAPGTQIRTGFRGLVTMRFGDNTVASVRRLSIASIDESYRTATGDAIKLGLGYGAIRAGATEGELRSDLVIDSTVATLAKRGTDGIEMNVERSTGRFQISLARQGLVEAIAKATNERRTVRPGEYANQSNIMRMWVKQDVFDRKVAFYSEEGVTDADASFAAANPSGVSVLAPGSGSEASEISGRNDPNFVNQAREDEGDDRPGTFTPPPFFPRPEGDFGNPDALSSVFRRIAERDGRAFNRSDLTRSRDRNVRLWVKR